MSKKCLVICPFGPEGSEIRKRSDILFNEMIKTVVSDAGYDDIYRLIDDANPGSISTQMISDLYGADLVIADLTGLNPNVFYELALRHSIAKPFIHISSDIENIPFDIQEISVIKIETDYAGGKKFIEKLKNQIQKIKQGKGDFENPASKLHPGPKSHTEPGNELVKVYRWKMKYTNSLAKDWLNLQDDTLKKCVTEYERDNKIPDQPLYRQGIAEYVGYHMARNQWLAGDLFYFLEPNNTFKGWGDFELPGSANPLAIKIEGEEIKENDTVRIVINFWQPSRKIQIATSIYEEIRAFYYQIIFDRDATERGRYSGKLFHPDYETMLVCECNLISYLRAAH